VSNPQLWSSSHKSDKFSISRNFFLSLIWSSCHHSGQNVPVTRASWIWVPSCLQCPGDYDPELGLLRGLKTISRMKSSLKSLLIWNFQLISSCGILAIWTWSSPLYKKCSSPKFARCPCQARLCGVAVLSQTQVAWVPCGCALSAYSDEASTKSLGMTSSGFQEFTCFLLKSPTFPFPPPSYDMFWVSWVFWHYFKIKIVPNLNMSFPSLSLIHVLVIVPLK
jgi:hypothetical protein